MRRAAWGVLFLGAMVWGTGCSKGQPGPQEAGSASNEGAMNGQQNDQQGDQQDVGRAVAKLEPTEGHQATGNLEFVVDNGVVRVTGTIEGLTPDAEHGFHIHEKGDCSAPDAASAGGHYDPHGRPHGDPQGDKHHMGDMKNLEADSAGVARVDREIESARLGDGSEFDLVGKAVIVHLAPDDYSTQPAGASGARIACGVIQKS